MLNPQELEDMVEEEKTRNEIIYDEMLQHARKAMSRTPTLLEVHEDGTVVLGRFLAKKGAQVVADKLADNMGVNRNKVVPWFDYWERNTNLITVYSYQLPGYGPPRGTEE